MIRTARHKTFWLNTIKLLVIVFTLNASTGFSACCINANNDGANTSSKTDMTSASMPCHGGQAEQTPDVGSNLDNNACCSSCIMTALPLNQLASSSAPLLSTTVNTFQYFISCDITPPFKPPISQYS